MEKEKKHPGRYGVNGAYAQAYALFNCAYAGGTLVGPLWSGLLVDRAGWSTMTWTLGLLSIVTAVPAALWTGGFIRKKSGNLQQRVQDQDSPI